MAPSRGEDTVEAVYAGLFSAGYEYRGMGDYADHDAYGYWSYRAKKLSDGRVDIYTSGRLHSDLDGTTSSSYDPFSSISDGSSSDLRLLQFYVDIHDRSGEKAMRYGRQYVDIADYIQMDGAQVMLFENQAIGGRVFLGQPVSDYTSVNRDLFTGASLIGRPWKGNQTRATYARYQDDSESAADDHYFLNMKQRFSDELLTRTYVSVMNDDLRMGGADLIYVSMSDYVFDGVMGIRRWGDYHADTRVYSPLVQVLGDQEPYTTAYGHFTAQIIPSIYISPGAMTRRPDDENATNSSFDRYNVDLIFEPSKAFSASTSLEYWDLDNEQFYGISGDVRYRYQKLWEVSAGAAYVDYTYFDFPDFSLTADGGSTIVGEDGVRIEVSPNAYTYYLRGKWNINKNTALRLSGEIEDDSNEEDLAYRFRSSLEVRL